ELPAELRAERRAARPRVRRRDQGPCLAGATAEPGRARCRPAADPPAQQRGAAAAALPLASAIEAAQPVAPRPTVLRMGAQAAALQTPAVGEGNPDARPAVDRP